MNLINPLNNVSIDRLHFERVCFAYDSGENILDDLNLVVPVNQIVQVTGAPGRGKSCFLRLLAGIEYPQAGAIYINQNNVTQMSFEEFLPYRLKIGYGFDYGGLISNMSIRENLLLPLRYHKILSEKEASEKVDYYLRHFDLKRVENERPAFIPGSMRKEACVVRAFILDPEMIVLDRPTVGVNIENKVRLKNLIQEKKKEGSLKHVYIASDDHAFLEGLVETELCLDRNVEADVELSGVS